MSQPNLPPHLRNRSVAQAPTHANPLIASILDMANQISKPLKQAMLLREKTQMARERVKQLQNKFQNLEDAIEKASNQPELGKRFDRYR